MAGQITVANLQSWHADRFETAAEAQKAVDHFMTGRILVGGFTGTVVPDGTDAITVQIPYVRGLTDAIICAVDTCLVQAPSADAIDLLERLRNHSRPTKFTHLAIGFALHTEAFRTHRRQMFAGFINGKRDHQYGWTIEIARAASVILDREVGLGVAIEKSKSHPSGAMRCR